MKRFEKFLFFYSIIALIALFVSFGIFEPRPLNFLAVFSLAPIIFYFMVRLSSPQTATPGVWSIRFFVTIALLGALGVYAFFLSKQFTNTGPVTNQQLVDEQKQNEELKTKITALNGQIADMKNQSPPAPGDESITDIIYGTPPDSSPSGTLLRIKAKSGITKIDVHKDASLTSTKIGSVDIQVIYPYLEKLGTWYKIVYPGGITGWVSATQVEEIQ